MRYQQIVTNFKPIVRNETLQGKDRLVVPMVMMVEGVLAGNCGPIFYPAAEMKEIPIIWNTKPTVVYHPEDNGAYGSACTPEELESRQIGIIMNTKFVPATNTEKAKLTSEAWLDPERIDIVDSRVAEAIANEAVMELSTGLYMDVEDIKGDFNGTEYTGIARNFRPDHLAILPDLQGACSVEDGAGFIRVNMAFTGNEMGHTTIRDMLQATVRDAFTNDEDYTWVEDVFDTHFVYEKGNDLYTQTYELDEKGKTVKLIGIPEQVVRVIKYESVKNEKGIDMDKKILVDELISNESTPWAEEDRESLMSLNDDALAKMKATEKTTVEVTEVQNAAEKGAAELKTEVTEVVENSVVEDVDTYIAKAPKELQPVLRHGMNAFNKQRDELITKIAANERNTFKKDFLMGKDIAELEAIANLCAPVVNTEDEDNRFTQDFSGQATVGAANSTEEPLGLPTTTA